MYVLRVVSANKILCFLYIIYVDIYIIYTLLLLLLLLNLFTKQDQKVTKKLLCVFFKIFFILFLAVGPVVPLCVCVCPFPFNKQC